MKIKSITIKNFKSIGNSPYTYHFDKKFVLIKGAPGKGKTLLLTAITFNLFGKNSDFKANSNSTLPTNKLINDINKKEMITEVVLSNGYKIIRGLAPAVFEIQNEKGININDLSAKKYDQEMLEQDILGGLNLSTFMTTNYLCSKPNSVPFLYMSKTQRKDYIETLLDLRIVYHLNENLKPVISENKLESNRLSSEESLLNNTIENEEFNIKQQLKRQEEQKSKIKDYQSDKELRIKEIQSNIESNDSELLILNQKLKYLNSDLDNLKRDFSVLDEGKFSLLSQTKNEKNILMQKLKDKMVFKKAEKDAFDKNKENYHMCGECPTLTKIIGSYDTESHNTFQLQSAKAYRKLQDSITALDKEIDYLNTVRLHNSSLEANMNTLLSTKRDLEYNISNLTNRNTNNERMIKQIESEVPPEIIEINLDYLKELKLKLDKVIDDKSINYNQSVDLDNMKKEINDKEHKSKALKSYLPLFEKKLNSLLESFLINMEFCIKAKLEDDFELTFYKNNKVTDIFGMSGGQKQLLSLATQFSFLYLLEVKSQNNFNHLFIDEILDMSLGVELPNVLDYLKEVSEYKSIDLISHNTSINEEIFDKIVTVEKENGFSKYFID